jgi:hypothetical protein
MENRRAPTQEEDYNAGNSVYLACEKAYYFFCALKDDADNLQHKIDDKAGYERTLPTG